MTSGGWLAMALGSILFGSLFAAMQLSLRETSRGARPEALASSFRSRAKCCRVRWPLSPEDGNSHFDGAAFFAFGVITSSAAR